MCRFLRQLVHSVRWFVDEKLNLMTQVDCKQDHKAMNASPKLSEMQRNAGEWRM